MVENAIKHSCFMATPWCLQGKRCPDVVFHCLLLCHNHCISWRSATQILATANPAQLLRFDDIRLVWAIQVRIDAFYRNYKINYKSVNVLGERNKESMDKKRNWIFHKSNAMGTFKSVICVSMLIFISHLSPMIICMDLWAFPLQQYSEVD